MEENNKLDKAIGQAIRQVGKERDAEDLATLKRFMAESISDELFSKDEFFIKLKRQEENNNERCCAKLSEKQQIENKRFYKEQFNRDTAKSKNSKVKKILSVISSIAAIIVIVFSLNIYQDNRRMDKLFETYYTPLEYDSQLMSRGKENISPELASAMESYQKEDYATALQKFEAIPDVDENYLIYKAICLLETEQTEDAVTLLELLVANGESTEYYQQACWYLALGYLSNHEKNKVLNIILLNKDLGNNFNLLHNSIK